MNRLEKITLFNSPCESREVSITLDAECDVLVLTGYNGVGKSRVLSAIMETISLVHDLDYSEWNENWLMRLEFGGGFIFHSLKFDSLGVVRKKDWARSVRQILVNPKPLQIMFVSVLKSVIDLKASDGFTSKSGSDESGMYCAVQLNKKNEQSASFVKQLKAVGFINDRVVFGYVRESEKAVFDKHELEGNLDKTLYVLISEFLSTQSAKSDYEQDIDRYIEEYLAVNSAEGVDRSDFFKATKEYVLAKIKNKIALESDKDFYASHPMFVGVNKIFSMTSRKLVSRDSTMGVELKGGKFVVWTSLSRGEKTLLALFLLVFLHRDGALFILDEPDLSLHMEWQKKLLPCLLDLAPKCQFIVATHSPFLVMNTGREQVLNMAKMVSQVV